MTPELIDKAQRMYDSRPFAMAEIAASCAVTHDHLPQHPHDPGRSHTPQHLTRPGATCGGQAEKSVGATCDAAGVLPSLGKAGEQVPGERAGVVESIAAGAAGRVGHARAVGGHRSHRRRRRLREARRAAGRPARMVWATVSWRA